MNHTIAFVWGIGGGLFVEILSWYKIRKCAEPPHWFQSVFYWISTLFMIIVGGLLVLAHMRSDVSLSPLLAINIGASAPLLIGTMADTAPNISAGTSDIDPQTPDPQTPDPQTPDPQTPDPKVF